jgi:hypothetical protein
LNSDDQQFHQYQQNKRKFIKQRWSTIPSISTKQKKFIKQRWSTILRPSLLKLSFVFLTLEELLTIIVQTFFWFVDIGGIVDHDCLNHKKV